MSRDTIIVVEGPHDAAVVAALLKPTFKQIESREEVLEHWRRFIPIQLPVKPNLPIRIDHPLFLGAQDGRQVLVRIAGSVEQIPAKLMADLKDLPGQRPHSIGVLLDADTESPPDRIEQLNRQLRRMNPPLTFHGPAGEIMETPGLRAQTGATNPGIACE